MSEPRLRFPARPCPVCGSEHPTKLYRQSFAQLSSASLMDGYDVVVCQRCGFAFADDIPEQTVFDEYYRDLSKYENPLPTTPEPPPVEQRLQDAAELIARFIPAPNSRILEIGSASGGLLKALQDRGFSSLLGLDPSPACIRAAQQLYGVPGIAGTVFTPPLTQAPFDFLILTGVMEHIRDLDGAIDQFRQLLPLGGRVYLEVPDASRYNSSLDAPFQEFSLEHINFFSSKSLTNLMQARGFRLIETGEHMRPLHEALCPCTFGVFEYTAQSSPPPKDTVTESGLRAYIQGCQTEDRRIRSIIEQAVPASERMIVWGVGAHTLRLLATGGLDPHKIALFVDSNTKYQQRELSGIPVVSPNDIQSRREPILISSRSSQRDIQQQIQTRLGFKNPLILLYNS